MPAERVLAAARERDFWDAHVPPIEETLRAYERGPDSNTRLLLDSLEPLAEARVLDVGCGMGLLSAWLAARGARVTGVDPSARAVDAARPLADVVGADCTFVVDALPTGRFQEGAFDRLAGRFAIHHLPGDRSAAYLAGLLAPGGRAAFLETTTNPVLAFARRHVAGRYGVARYGTEDERPLTRDDLERLRSAFGGLRLDAAEVRCFGILDRQVLRYRVRPLSRCLAAADGLLLRLGAQSASYHQVLVLGEGEARV